MSWIKDIPGKAIKSVDNYFNVSQQQPKYITPFESKTRFTMIGPVGAGKTVVAANLLRTAYTRSQRDPDFYCEIKEFGSDIRESVAAMMAGHFPPKTIPTGEYAYEAGFTITKKGFFGEKKLHIPLIDVAGEDQQTIMLNKYASPLEVRKPVNYLTYKTLGDYMKTSKGFIFVLCGERIYLPGQKLDEEPAGISRYADVNISRMFDETVSWRKSKIEGILVFITKYDKIAPHLIDEKGEGGIDLYRSQGDMQTFMNNYFPGMKMALKKFEDKGLVKYFPSYVGLQKDEEGKTVYWPGTNEPVIQVLTKDSLGRPYLNYRYAEPSYDAAFDYLESFAR